MKRKKKRKRCPSRRWSRAPAARSRRRRSTTRVPFALEALPVAPVVARAGGAVKAPKIDYAGAFRLNRPYFTKLSLIALLTIIALAVVGEVVRPENQKIFMPG